MRPFAIAVYNLIMWFYYKGAKLLSVFSPKAKSWVNGISHQNHLIATFKTPQNANRIWFHCSSLGEFEQARPLIEMTKENVKNCCIYITFFSPSGYNVMQHKTIADYVFYLPLDTQQNAQNFIEKLKPTLVFWTKYDFFFHHLTTIKKQAIPCILFSARFLGKQIFFKFYGLLHREMLSCFDSIFVQNQNSKILLQTINIKSNLAPDTRFDRVITIAKRNTEFKEIIDFINGTNQVIVAGSTWMEDNKLLAETLQHFPNHQLIVAPHQVDSKTIDITQKLFESQQIDTILFSNFLASPKKSQALIIDCIGMLAEIYRYAKICYVGGGFGSGVHNVLEAVVYGKPTLVGTNFRKSIECVELVENGIVFSVKNSTELIKKIIDLNSDSKLTSIAQKAALYINANSGGTTKIFDYAKKYIH